MLTTHRKSGNDLLNALPDEAWQRLVPHLDPLDLERGQVVVAAGGAVRDVYFPATAIVSMRYLMASGHTCEVAAVGREGIVGVMACLGGERSIHQATVQNEGGAYRITAKAFKADFDRGGALAQAVLRYAQVLTGQLAENAACNRHGTLEQRLCRWLLSNFDRIDGRELTMTHEQIAQALGVKREGITEAAGRLRRDGAIDYGRGRVTALDRTVLERRTCECNVRPRLVEGLGGRANGVHDASPRPTQSAVRRSQPTPACSLGSTVPLAAALHEA